MPPKTFDPRGGAFQTAAVDIGEIERTISNLGKRQFVLRTSKSSALPLFATRWAMSYLAGPLTRDQIATLTALSIVEHLVIALITVGTSFRLLPLVMGVVLGVLLALVITRPIGPRCFPVRRQLRRPRRPMPAGPVRPSPPRRSDGPPARHPRRRQTSCPTTNPSCRRRFPIR